LKVCPFLLVWLVMIKWLRVTGTEPFLHNLIKRSQHDFTYLTSTLQPLRLAPAVRDTAATALMPPSKFDDLLYVLLIAGGHIVTLLRPRKHSIHPSGQSIASSCET
jgi:hypothetical protein